MESVNRLILSKELAQFLEEEGLASPILNNKRKLSTSSLSPPSSLPSRTVSTASHSDRDVSPANFAASFVSEEINDVEIPANLRSRETYSFLGFNNETAAKLWGRFVDAPADTPISFLDYAVSHIDENETHDACTASDDWDFCLKAHGINDKLRTAILLPEFADLRYTASCKYWIIDAIVMGYEELEAMDEIIRLEAASLQCSRSRPGQKLPSMASPKGRIPRTDPIPVRPHDSLSSTTPNPTVSPFSQSIGHNSVSSTTLPEASSSDTPIPIITTSSSAPSAIDGHTMIWRATSRLKAKSFYDQVTQTISLQAIATSPGDFSGDRSVTYWTTQKETADRYAQWCKRKMEVSVIAIIQVAVPNTFIESLTVEYLWFGDSEKPTNTWKILVWHGRKGLSLPKEIRYLEQRDLLIGHIASGVHAKCLHMIDATKIKESDVLTVEVDGEEKRSIQWVFHTYNAKDAFAEKCAGKVWIHNVGCFKVPPEGTVSAAA